MRARLGHCDAYVWLLPLLPLVALLTSFLGPLQSATASRPRLASEVRSRGFSLAVERFADWTLRPCCPGINLSGGQKARACLARCVYSDADICFLDDPVRLSVSPTPQPS